MFRRCLTILAAIGPSLAWAGASYHYDSTQAGPHALTSINSTEVTYHYDRNGNPYERNENGIVRRFSYTSTLHVKKVEKGTDVQHSIYDAEGNKLAAVLGNGQKIITYVGGIRMITESSTSTPRALMNYGDAELNETGDVDYFLRDHLGSVVAMADRMGIMETKDALPYGADWYLKPTAGSEDFTDYDFTGQRKEGELFDYNARQMMTTGEGRFLQADTVIDGVGSSGGYNRYAYVQNNPSNYTDPTGRQSRSVRPVVIFTDTSLDEAEDRFRFKGTSRIARVTPIDHPENVLQAIRALKGKGVELVGIEAHGYLDRIEFEAGPLDRRDVARAVVEARIPAVADLSCFGGEALEDFLHDRRIITASGGFGLRADRSAGRQILRTLSLYRDAAVKTYRKIEEVKYAEAGMTLADRVLFVKRGGTKLLLGAVAGVLALPVVVGETLANEALGPTELGANDELFPGMEPSFHNVEVRPRLNQYITRQLLR